MVIDETETHQTLEDLLVPMIMECRSKDEAKTLLQIYGRLSITNNTTAQNVVAIHACLLNDAFHHLWTKAVRQEQYVKAEWEAFRNQLMKATGIAI